MSDEPFDTAGLGFVVLMTPVWLPLVACFGVLWCIGWLARFVYTHAVSAMEARRER